MGFLKLEHIMVLNNLTKFLRIIIKTIHVREQTLFQPMIFDVTKFHKILIKTIRLRERTSFKMVNFHKQRAITAEKWCDMDHY